MRSKDFFSEIYYADENVMENEGNEEVISISHALPTWSHVINNLIMLFARALVLNSSLRAEFFYLWTSLRGWGHKAKILSLSLAFYSKAPVQGD